MPWLNEGPDSLVEAVTPCLDPQHYPPVGTVGNGVRKWVCPACGRVFETIVSGAPE